MKIAVITGAASGIGLALAQVHLQKGHTVLMVDKDQAKLKAEAQALQTDKVLYKCCDVTQENEVNKLTDYVKTQFEEIDFLYNNAGILGPLSPIWEADIASIRQVMEVNLFGMIHMIQAFVPLFLNQNKPAQIINMASLYALCTGSQLAAYTMSKHAVLALSESLYFDLLNLQKDIHVSVVFPSFTNTALLSSNTTINPFQDSLKQLLTHSKPALDLAQQITSEVDKKKFYILPDLEVKSYCEGRTTSIINQEMPYLTSIEKLMNSLRKRACNT